jgi:hypothetical protein
VFIRAEGGVFSGVETFGGWLGRLIAEQRATITHEKSSAAAPKDVTVDFPFYSHFYFCERALACD